VTKSAFTDSKFSSKNRETKQVGQSDHKRAKCIGTGQVSSELQ